MSEGNIGPWKRASRGSYTLASLEVLTIWRYNPRITRWGSRFRPDIGQLFLEAEANRLHRLITPSECLERNCIFWKKQKKNEVDQIQNLRNEGLPLSQSTSVSLWPCSDPSILWFQSHLVSSIPLKTQHGARKQLYPLKSAAHKKKPQKTMSSLVRREESG